ncbi:MAG: polyamine aminopropyltransferase [Geminicoccaceae bacterium]|nr:MAG: polyamine aminopropyltransferase [Geminicoccaceae bacterium]
MSVRFTDTVTPGVDHVYTGCRVLVEERTELQHLVLFEHDLFGQVLLLDGATQVTTADEHVYHEMMAHVPILAHGAVRDVLIVGGGDGGLARRVLEHAAVERLTQVEIDPDVVRFARAHLQPIHQGAFDDPRMDLVIADGLVFARETERRFDLVLVDSTDPVGPAAALIEEPFYRDLQRCLKPGGIVVTQSSVPFFQDEPFKRSLGNLRRVFEAATCYMITVPTYFGGQMALGFSGAAPVDLATLEARYRAAGLQTRYYAPDVHLAAFALPPYVRELLAAA